MLRSTSWSRRILFALFVAHAALTLAAIASGIWTPPDYLTVLLFVLNAAAIAGIATRTRFGWFIALLFIAACVGRYSWSVGLDSAGSLGLILGMAAAVLCLTDPAFRREHGIAT